MKVEGIEPNATEVLILRDLQLSIWVESQGVANRNSTGE
jgi:hypothetical protein